MATMGTEEIDRCREVAIVERFKQESVYDLSAQKMAIVERWLLVEFQLYLKHVSRVLQAYCSKFISCFHWKYWAHCIHSTPNLDTIFYLWGIDCTSIRINLL